MKKQNRWFVMVVVLATVTFSSGQRIYADWDAEKFAQGFNSMNSNQGFNFSYALNDIDGDLANLNLLNPDAAIILTNLVPGGPDVLGVYNNNEFVNSKYKTFCVQPKVPIAVGKEFWGTLNYSDGKTFTYQYDPDNQSQKNPLSIGAAYLYKAYVTGEFGVFKPVIDGGGWKYSQRDIGMAIRTLMGVDDYGLTWNQGLLNWLVSDVEVEVDGKMQKMGKDYWTTPYDLTKTYSFMEDYHVFVLNVTGANDQRSQDFLYITRASPPPHAPEPATILLWTLGTVGAAGYLRRRSQLNKQIVV